MKSNGCIFNLLLIVRTYVYVIHNLLTLFSRDPSLLYGTDSDHIIKETLVEYIILYMCIMAVAKY